MKRGILSRIWSGLISLGEGVYESPGVQNQVHPYREAYRPVRAEATPEHYRLIAVYLRIRA